MARLDCDANTIPIIKTEWGYTLREDIREAWRRLENMFLSITGMLLASCHGSKEAKMPFDAHWALPRECGYLHGHRTGHAARIAAMRSRDACVLLLARCTMATALCAQLGESPPGWVRVLENRGVPAVWIDFLQQSVISDLSPGLRTGAFVYPTETKWMHHVPCMIRANLPVYICWKEGVALILDKFPFLRDYAPPDYPVPLVQEEHPGSLRFRWHNTTSSMAMEMEPAQSLPSMLIPTRNLFPRARKTSRSVAAFSNTETSGLSVKTAMNRRVLEHQTLELRMSIMREYEC